MLMLDKCHVNKTLRLERGSLLDLELLRQEGRAKPPCVTCQSALDYNGRAVRVTCFMKFASIILCLVLPCLAAAESLIIKPAVQLEFSTAPDKAYQLLRSDELGTWTPFELL